ncbi:hypothetical protein B0G84_5699 [Paraburkholderia sp. BL8N3]|nr:hypothetical protein [Paraburkholderia sp. BL8N3]TCK36686.1 hypothetical protein B0G84_5699 [Paraburkholderia sp. BL8N3]
MTRNDDKRDEAAALMASETVAGDLLSALVSEVRLLPDIWPKIGEDEQNEIIERLRKRVLDNVREATRLIASAGRTTIVGEMKKVSFGDKTVATLEFGKQDPTAMELCHAQGMTILVVIADAGAHMGGVDGVRGEPDQRSLPGVEGDGSAAQIIEQASRRSKRKPKDGDQPATH